MILEHALNLGLGQTLVRRYEHPPGRHRDATFVTAMWIYAALVYLHIVTVGSRSGHPKLRRYVARGLDAYINLPRRLDIHIGMPFGILASMASREEAQQFLKIAETPRGRRRSIPASGRP